MDERLNRNFECPDELSNLIRTQIIGSVIRGNIKGPQSNDVIKLCLYASIWRLIKTKGICFELINDVASSISLDHVEFAVKAMNKYHAKAEVSIDDRFPTDDDKIQRMLHLVQSFWYGFYYFFDKASLEYEENPYEKTLKSINPLFLDGNPAFKQSYLAMSEVDRRIERANFSKLLTLEIRNKCPVDFK